MEDFAKDYFVSFKVGGGFYRAKNLQGLMHAGAREVRLTAVIFNTLGLVSKIAQSHRSLCLMVSIDIRWVGDKRCRLSHSVKNLTEYEVKDWAYEMHDRL